MERAEMSGEELRERRANKEPKKIGKEIMRIIERKEGEIRRKKTEESSSRGVQENNNRGGTGLFERKEGKKGEEPDCKI